MYDVCRCNVPLTQPCAGCNGAIPVSQAVVAARVDGAQKGYAECQRDAVAWLRLRVSEAVADWIERGEHVGFSQPTPKDTE